MDTNCLICQLIHYLHFYLEIYKTNTKKTTKEVKFKKQTNIYTIIFSKCFKDRVKLIILVAAVLACLFFLKIILVEQLPSFKPSSHKHYSSVCRQVSDLQSGERFREQFVPKYPSLQAKRKSRCYRLKVKPTG